MSVERGSESTGKAIFGSISKITVVITFILGCVAFVPLALIEAHKQKIDTAAAIVFSYQAGEKICKGQDSSYNRLVRDIGDMAEIYSPEDVRLLSSFYAKCLSDHNNGWSWPITQIEAESKILVSSISRELMLNFAEQAHKDLEGEGGLSLDQVEWILGKNVEKVYSKRMHFPPYLMMFLLSQIIAIALVSVYRMTR